MAENSELNALYRKLAALERRIHKLENNYQELDTVVDPQGWIGEAFERMEQDINELRQEVRQNGQKLDLILQHLTGMQQ
jgi:predicted RNase H-like nuclease (RuvC/YqgF family)